MLLFMCRVHYDKLTVRDSLLSTVPTVLSRHPEPSPHSHQERTQ